MWFVTVLLLLLLQVTTTRAMGNATMGNATMVNATMGNTTMTAEGAISLVCSELDMTASFYEAMVPGNVTNMTVVDCASNKYNRMGNTISVDFKDCVKNITEGPDQITQENVIAVTVSVPDKTNTIHRVTVYYYTLQCKFDRRFNITNAVAAIVSNKEETIKKESITNFTASMTFFQDKQFTMPVQGSLQVAAFEPIYIKIRGVNNNTYFKFVTEDCYATPTADPMSTTRYLFFTNKCPIDGTFMEIDNNYMNTYTFSIQAFTFIKLKKEVYFHCSLLVCKAESTSQECNQTCTGLSRKRRAITDDGALEEVMTSSGPIQYKSKPTCDDTTCQTNAYCVNLYPAICRCNDGFVLDQSTGECSNVLLFTLRGLHLNMQFISTYADTSSDDFLQLAITVEKNLMTGYRLDRNTIKGIKVIRASPGSVVLDIQVRYSETVTSKEAFDSFIASVIKTEVVENVANIKRHILPALEIQNTEEISAAGIITAAVLCPVLLILLVAIIIWIIWNKRRRSSKEKFTGFNNDAMSVDTISA